MSAFADILESLVRRVPGTVAAIFVDYEGEAVDLWSELPRVDVQLIGAHWSVVFGLASDHLAATIGDVEEIWIEAAQGLVLIRRVTDEYYVVLAAKPGTHLASARRELERGATTLFGEI